MTKLTVMQGIPASGKSTRARQLAKEGARIVSRDYLRKEMTGSAAPVWGDRALEDSVTVAEEAMVLALLRAGEWVVVDATHTVPRTLRRWNTVAARTGAELEVITCDVTLEEALKRNKGRANEVQEGVIAKMHANLEKMKVHPPTLFDTHLEPYTTPAGAPPVILVDLDGTLALLGERSPYQIEGIENDEPRKDLRALLAALEGAYDIVFMSGRGEAARESTMRWLEKHMLWFDRSELHMRPDGDYRPDWIVKYELFNQHVRDRFDVVVVFDDRDQVVDMWRRLGLTVYQVAPGNF